MVDEVAAAQHATVRPVLATGVVGVATGRTGRESLTVGFATDILGGGRGVTIVATVVFEGLESSHQMAGRVLGSPGTGIFEVLGTTQEVEGQLRTAQGMAPGVVQVLILLTTFQHLGHGLIEGQHGNEQLTVTALEVMHQRTTLYHVGNRHLG